MERKEIQETLEALECCSSPEMDCCRDCPYRELGLVECTQKLAAGALAYIKELGGSDIYERLLDNP